MSTFEDPEEAKKDVSSQSSPPNGVPAPKSPAPNEMPTPTSPPPDEMPKPTAPPSGDQQSTKMDGRVTGIVRQWKRNDLLKKGSLWSRGIAFLFSMLSFIIMASNKHGDGMDFNDYEEYSNKHGEGMDFNKYEEYRYVLAVAILSSLYTAGQVFRQVHELSTGKFIFERRMAMLIDFVGDQVMAYLLISASSAAVPVTDRLREIVDNIFTDSLAAAITMSFLAFFSLAFSALISGYKLSTQPYI